MNNKSTPNQMRILLKRMRTGNYVAESKEKLFDDKKGTTKHELSMRDMLKITRKLNEDVETPAVDAEEDKKKAVNKETAYDQKREEDKLVNLFGDDVSFEFKDLEVYDDWVLWSGVANGVIQFLFIVTRDEITSRVEFNYLQGFSPDNPKNDEIIEKLQTYYETTFSKYWRNNLIQQ